MPQWLHNSHCHNGLFDIKLSSEGGEEDNEINLMAKCVEMKMSAPIRIPGPSCAVRTKEDIVPSGLPKHEMLTRPVTPRPMLNPSIFCLGKGDGPIPRDDRLRDGHPTILLHYAEN